MKKKENQRIALTKRLLKESLLRLMDTKSIQDITVTELCESAEINRTTFYNHYGCPADVLRDIEGDLIEDLVLIWDEKCAGNPRPLNERAEILCSYFHSHREMVKRFFRDNSTNEEFTSQMFQASHIRLIYAQAFADIDEDSQRLMTTFLCNGSYHMIRQWILEDIPKTPKEMGDMICLIATQLWEQLSSNQNAHEVNYAKAISK